MSFENSMEVRFGVNLQPLREIPGIGRNLQMLRGSGLTTVNGSRFWDEFNALNIHYGGEGSIVIAMQDADSDDETIITIRTIRQDGYDLANIKIAAKYTIMQDTLSENVGRLASGSRQQQSPHGDTHVLLFGPGMLQSTCILEINAIKYYIEWGRRWNNQHPRADVYVSTEHSYTYRLANVNREMVYDRWMYFRGQQAPNRNINVNQRVAANIQPIENANGLQIEGIVAEAGPMAHQDNEQRNEENEQIVEIVVDADQGPDRNNEQMNGENDNMEEIIVEAHPIAEENMVQLNAQNGQAEVPVEAIHDPPEENIVQAVDETRNGSGEENNSDEEHDEMVIAEDEVQNEKVSDDNENYGIAE